MEILDIEQTIRKCLRLLVGESANDISRDMPVREAVASFDSLMAMDFIAAIEDAFQVEVDFVQHDVRFHMETIAKSVDFVRDLLQDKEVLGA